MRRTVIATLHRAPHTGVRARACARMPHVHETTTVGAEQRLGDLNAITKKNAGANSGNGTTDQHSSVRRSGMVPSLLIAAFAFAACPVLLRLLAPCTSRNRTKAQAGLRAWPT